MLGERCSGIAKALFRSKAFLDEVFLAVLFGLHHNIGPEPARLKAPWRIRLAEAVKRRGGQHMNDGKRRKKSAPVTRSPGKTTSLCGRRLFYIRPIPSALAAIDLRGARDYRRDEGHPRERARATQRLAGCRPGHW